MYKYQHRLLLSEIRLPTPKQTRDAAVKVKKIRWRRLREPEGGQFLLEMQGYMQDVVNKEDDLDTNKMWQAFQDGSTSRAKEILGVSKGKLNIGKESWFWKGEAIKNAVAFKLWSKCPSS